MGHHSNVVGQTALHVAYYAVMLIRLADADVTFAAHHGGAELSNITCRLPGNVEDTGQTVEVVLYVLWHTRSWRESKERKESFEGDS